MNIEWHSNIENLRKTSKGIVVDTQPGKKQAETQRFSDFFKAENFQFT